jgi:Methyltransferase domain.
LQNDSPVPEDRVQTIKKYVSNGSKVLVIGCTSPEYEILSKLYDVECIHLNALGKVGKFMMFEYNDYPDNYFDAVLAFDTLEHMYAPFITIGEIRRVLKDGVWASLDFMDPILSPWASTESRGIAPLIPLRPFSGITPPHLLPLGVKKRWGNPHILRYMLRDAFNCLSRVNPHLSHLKVLPTFRETHPHLGQDLDVRYGLTSLTKEPYKGALYFKTRCIVLHTVLEIFLDSLSSASWNIDCLFNFQQQT